MINTFPEFATANDYYPFGMLMPGRNSDSTYRFGFNGKENLDEIKGEGKSIDYGFRSYDPRLGKFLSIDPLTSKYPWYTPYQFSGNNPIQFIDIDGAEPGKQPFMLSDPGSTIMMTQKASAIGKALLHGTVAFVLSIPNMIANSHIAGNAKNPTIKAEYERKANEELANFTMGYMTGIAFKSLVQSVGKIIGSEVAASAAESKILFRGDSRNPEEIFKSGFGSKGKNTDIPEYVEINEPSIFVGASKSPTVAATKAPTGFVYVVENNGKGIDVNNYYKAIEGAENPFKNEAEVIFEKIIPSNQIKGAFPVIEGKINTDKFIPNPNYKN